MKQVYARTTLASVGISVCGVTLWNSYDENVTSLATVNILFKNLSNCFFKIIVHLRKTEVVIRRT